MSSPKSAGKRTPKKSPRKKAVEEVVVAVEKLPLGHFHVSSTCVQNAQRRPQPLRLYINIEDMADLNMHAGDFVLISNSNQSSGRALGIAWPTMAIKQSNIQMAAILLENSFLAGEDIALVETAEQRTTSIAKILVHPLEIMLQDPVLAIYLKEVMIDIEYFIDGQIIETPYNGKIRKFKVTIDLKVQLEELSFTKNVSIYRVTKATKVTIKYVKKIKSAISYDSIGGLKEQVRAIREMVEVPLLYPERFTRYGLPPPKGLLLYGPPGTGKTLTARAVAAEAGAHVIIINGSEISSEFHGETESKLKAIFEEAIENAPTIIFLDEIDALCPSREGSNSEEEKRTVTCLLALMDGNESIALQDRPRILIMGATNRPNALDSALRRIGRFDREFEIGIPNETARFDILLTILKPIRHRLSNENIQLIASKAHGYVGADLSAICREAGVCAIKRLQLVSSGSDRDLSLDPNLALIMDDMVSGLSMVRPSVVREVVLDVPKVYWDEIGGQEDIKQKLKEAIEWPLKHPEVFLRFNIRPPKGLLLYGPPGCSKTLMAKALATEAGLNFLAVKGPELFSKWVGESEKAVQQIFKKARAASPSIIFFDEIDALAVKRSDTDTSVADRVLSQLLSEMDGIEPLVNVTIIAATNRPDILDNALLRPGRIDSILYVAPPDFESRKSIFAIQIKKMPCSSDVDQDELAKLSEGFSGAETVAVCQQAALAAMEESVTIEFVEHRHFLAAIRNTTKRITPEIVMDMNLSLNNMSDALTPMVVTSVFATITGFFPSFCSWRFYKNEAEVPVTRTEKQINYIIIAALTALHLAEVVKSFYFGFEYQGSKYGEVALIALISVLAEAGHILTLFAVLARGLSLVNSTKQLTDENRRDFNSMVVYVLGASRLCLPILAYVMKAKVNAFGLYTLIALLWDTITFAYVSVIVYSFLKKFKESDEQLNVPTWQLFSNAIVTTFLAFLSLLVLVLMACTYDMAYETNSVIVSTANSWPLVLPSIYAVFVGFSLVLYQDTQVILHEVRTPTTGKGVRRVKFEIY